MSIRKYKSITSKNDLNKTYFKHFNEHIIKVFLGGCLNSTLFDSEHKVQRGNVTNNSKYLVQMGNLTNDSGHTA